MAIQLAKVPRATPNATFRWLSGKTERVYVVPSIAERSYESERLRYVRWPESVRTVTVSGEAITGVRPSGWCSADRITMDAPG